MNKITKNELRTIVILLIINLLFLGSIFLLIKNVYALFISLCLFGFIISLLFKAKKEDFKIISKDFGIELLFAVIIPSLTTFIPSFIQQCEVFYFNRNEEVVINFENRKKEIEKKSYRFIFAFDNSGGKHFIDPIPLDYTFDFKDKIKAYVRNNQDHIDDTCFNKIVNYKNLLIERLCYDLINLEDNYEFQLVKIGDAQNSFNREWQLINSEQKINEIKFFFKNPFTKLQEQNTDFYHFYDHIDKITNENYIYVLCAYSDFVHDITEIDKRYSTRLRNFQQECAKIKEIQDKLTQKNIFQYLFYAPYKSTYGQYEKNILPDANNDKNIFHFDINAASNSLKVPNITHEIGKITMLISDNPEKIVATSLLMTFKEKGNTVQMQNDNSNNFSVFEINNSGQEQQYFFDKPLTTNKIRIKSKKDDETVKLEITENNTKYSALFHFEKKLTPIIGWLIIPLVAIFVGMLIGSICNWLIKKIF